MGKKIYWRSIDLFNAFLATVFFLINLFIQSSNENATASHVFLFSWCGVIIFAYVIMSYKAISQKVFTLYTLFILFFFLFNFGQCILWAFGVHVEGEVGSKALYGYVVPTEMDIIKTQAVFLSAVLIFHTVVVRKTIKPIENLNGMLDDEELSSGPQRRMLFQASLILSIVVIPVSLYYNLMQCIRASLYGYRSLYYGGVMDDVGGWVSIANRMFIPCIIGLIIGSGNDVKKRNMVYGIFFAYILISVMFGDRGSWLYAFVALVWFHHTYHRKFRVRSIVLYGIIAFLSLTLLDVMVALRNKGITIENIVAELSVGTSNPIVSTIDEMGRSMGVTVLSICDDLEYPYGNSYLMAFLGCITTKVPELLGLQYSTLTKWLSQEYLHLLYGAGFTVIAEAIVNTNVYLAPLMFIIYGLIFRGLLNANGSDKDPIKLFASVTICVFLFGLPRSTTHEFLKNMAFGIAPFFIIMWLLRQRRRI